jgi:rubredoxin
MAVIARDTPCPVCGSQASFDVSWFATEFKDGSQRWGRAHVCNLCGVVRWYDAAKPAGFEGALGSYSIDQSPPP